MDECRGPPPTLSTTLGALYATDCFNLFAALKDASIACVFADPPFNLGKARSHINELKPMIPARCVQVATNEGEIILDPFGGGGSTYEAAQRLKRRWIGSSKNCATSAQPPRISAIDPITWSGARSAMRGSSGRVTPDSTRMV